MSSIEEIYKEFPGIKTTVNCLLEKKAEEILVIDIRGLSPLTDFFIIASSGSSKQTDALSNEISLKLKDDELQLHHFEGQSSNKWLLLDYRDFIIHIFDKESREFYDIERLWADAIFYEIN